MTTKRLFDLEERTEKFARDVRVFVRQLPKSISSIEDAEQLIRSSGSVAANYIEANEAVSKKDFLNRLKICRKESKESRLWIRLIDTAGNTDLKEMRQRLIRESTELMLIFSSIITKSS